MGYTRRRRRGAFGDSKNLVMVAPIGSGEVYLLENGKMRAGCD
jgi:hypothetical protein